MDGHWQSSIFTLSYSEEMGLVCMRHTLIINVNYKRANIKALAYAMFDEQSKIHLRLVLAHTAGVKKLTLTSNARENIKHSGE